MRQNISLTIDCLSGRIQPQFAMAFGQPCINCGWCEDDHYSPEQIKGTLPRDRRESQLRGCTGFEPEDIGQEFEFACRADCLGTVGVTEVKSEEDIRSLRYVPRLRYLPFTPALINRLTVYFRQRSFALNSTNEEDHLPPFTD